MGIEVSKAEPTAVLDRSQLTRAKTSEVAKWWSTFRKHCPYFALNSFMFEDFFCVTLQNLHNTQNISAEVIQRVFASLDEAQQGLVDGFELFAALVILSEGSVLSKMDVLFSIFDVNGKGSIGQTALSMLLERSLSGLSKCCSCLGVVTSPGLPTKMARQAFTGKNHDEELSRAEFQKWWENETAVRKMMQKFSLDPDEEAGLPVEGLWRSEVYAELDAKDTAPPLLNASTESISKDNTIRFADKKQRQIAREAAVTVLGNVLASVADKSEQNMTRSPFQRWQSVY